MIPYFTPRQRRVARMVALGLYNADIGRRIGNTRKSVKNVLKALHEKTGMDSRLEFALWYWHHFPEELALKRTAELLRTGL